VEQEARVAASVNHPDVVKVYSFGSDHGQFYLVMKLIDQGSLDDFIEQRQQLPSRKLTVRTPFRASDLDCLPPARFR
jgi:serine/threonine protein kinase